MNNEILLMQNENGEFEQVKDEYTIYCDNEEDFQYLKTLVKIGNVIKEYAENHELATECGSEYIMQNDEAQIDGLQLVCQIFDILVDEQTLRGNVPDTNVGEKGR